MTDRLELRRYVDGAADVLAEAGVPSPRPDALALAAYALGLPHVELALAPPLPEGFAAEFAELVERRRTREPLQHILGYAVFRYVTLRVEPGVFVPRPETEVVAQAAIDEAVAVGTPERPAVVVDLCTGTGAIAAAVDTEVPHARVTAVELADDAVGLARANIGAVARPGTRVVQGDVRDPGLLADLDGAVDVLVSNPPYIPPHAVPIDPEVRDHDPDLALYGGGADGLAVPGAVVTAAARLLRPGGLFVMEHADEQGAAVRELVAATGAFETIETVRDLTDRDRFVRARRR